MSKPALRIYERQWVIVYASPENGPAGREHCEAEFTARWLGRVHSEDVSYAPASELEPDRFPWYLKLRLWNLAAEFIPHDPSLYEKTTYPDERAVYPGTPEERELLDYGRKKLA